MNSICAHITRPQTTLPDRDLGEYDVNLQVTALTPGKDATDVGMALDIAPLSAILGRTIGAQPVVLGPMSLHGVLSRVDGLGDNLRVALGAGARRVPTPTESCATPASTSPRGCASRTW